MRKLINYLAIVAVSVSLTSCAATWPYAVTELPVGSKTGVSSSTVLFGTIFLNGDFGVKDAAKNGKITGGISTVDQKVTNYLLFMKYELIVTGE